MTTLHETGEPTCPRCGEILEDDFDEVRPGIAEVAGVRTPLDCPACGAPLGAVVARAEDAIGLDGWIEDQREGKP